jgi:hypothetical protein
LTVQAERFSYHVLRRNRNMKRRESSPILLSVLLLVLGTSSCNLFSGSSGPPPEVSIVQAKDLGVIPTNPDILGRDGANSALFQGQSVWLYSDTFLAKPDAQDRTLISNSWSFTTNLNAQNGLSGFREQLDTTGAPTMILLETAAEQAFNQLHNVNNCQAQPCGEQQTRQTSGCRTTLKITVVAAMPSARVRIDTAANPGFLRSCRSV